jgi:hypothetical protein
LAGRISEGARMASFRLALLLLTLVPCYASPRGVTAS